MDIKTARRVIETEKDPPIGRLVLAVAVLSSPDNEEFTTLEDLMLCLERGTSFGRLNTATELAVLGLYRKTGRPRSGTLPYEDFITDLADWRDYIKKMPHPST